MSKMRHLKKETEMRCEISESSSLTIKLVNGTAEIFGVELAPNKEYTFRDRNIALFTWYGCTIELSGDESGLYETDSTPMVAYVNTHVQLEARRDVALSNRDKGPRVIVVGPVDHGKSTLSQILSAYAVRLDRTPLFIDLDIGQGSFCVPGCIYGIPLDKACLSVEEGFANVTPLVYFHGSVGPKDNVELYKALVDTMATKINERLSRDIDAQSSGIIVNTCGWIDAEGYDLLLHAIKAFSIDIVLVMNHDKLYSNLVTSLDPAVITTVKLPRSGGVVQRNTNTRKRLRKCRIKEYFYGKMTTGVISALSPERKELVPLNNFTFLRVGGVQLSEGMKVFGDTSSSSDSFKLTKVLPSQDFVYNIVGVLHNIDLTDPSNKMTNNNSSSSSSNSTTIGTTDVSLQQLITSNIAGFISIVQIDIDRGYMTILCPCPGALPSSYLLVGSIKWLE